MGHFGNGTFWVADILGKGYFGKGTFWEMDILVPGNILGSGYSEPKRRYYMLMSPIFYKIIFCARYLSRILIYILGMEYVKNSLY